MDEELLKKLEKFFEAFDDIVKDEKKIIKEVSKCDKQMSALYHYIEGMPIGTIHHSHKLIKELQEVLKNRRIAKGSARIMQSFVSGLKPKLDKHKKGFDEIMNLHQEVLDEISERAYTREELDKILYHFEEDDEKDLEDKE